MNSGSRDSFQVCWRCGASPNAFQVRCIAGRRRLAPDQHGHGRGARGPARERLRDHIRELSGDRHQGDGQAGRLVVLASGPTDALNRAQPIFDAIASKTVRLEPEARGASRLKLVANAWTVGMVESVRAQLSRRRQR